METKEETKEYSLDLTKQHMYMISSVIDFYCDAAHSLLDDMSDSTIQKLVEEVQTLLEIKLKIIEAIEGNLDSVNLEDINEVTYTDVFGNLAEENV